MGLSVGVLGERPGIAFDLPDRSTFESSEAVETVI